MATANLLADHTRRSNHWPQLGPGRTAETKNDVKSSSDASFPPAGPKLADSAAIDSKKGGKLSARLVKNALTSETFNPMDQS
jgi:hypothetical protein